MKQLQCCYLILYFLVIIQYCVAPPVTANKKEDSKDSDASQDHKGADWDIGIEYNRYLQEVVQALESDPDFREKLEKAEVADIRTGKIASELEFVSHHVRSKLDELKRQELSRLRHLAVKQAELQRQMEHHGGSDSEEDSRRVEDPNHVDHENPHTFEVEDLRKLIVQTTLELEEADRKRREEFKEYEMQKEFEKQQQLNLLDEQHKKELEDKIKEQENKHKNHPNLHHPGSKQQLEEVWEEQDHMNPDDFNPKAFFHLHDLDGNGFWDADEVKALFQKELDKMYDPNAPEDDMRERREEMERMREHVFNESDVNKDKLISYQEFLDQTKKQEFDQDQGWDGLDKQDVYTQEEYHQFEQRRQAEIQQMIQQGLLPPAPDLHLPYGMQVPPEYLKQQHEQNRQYQDGHHQLPPLHHQGAPQDHSGQQYHGQPPQYHPNQVPQYQQHPPQGNQYQGHPNQVPQHPPQGNQYQGHPNQVPQHPPQGNQYQGHPNQVPQHPPQGNQYQGHPNQVPQHPPQGNQNHPNQVPQHPPQGNQYQNHPNQVPQHPPQGNQYQVNQPDAGHPNQVQQHPPQGNQYQVHQPDAGHPNQAPPHPAQGNQYQVNQPDHKNQIPQGQIPQQQINSGQVNQVPTHNQANAGQVPHGSNQQQQNIPPQQNAPANPQHDNPPSKETNEIPKHN